MKASRRFRFGRNRKNIINNDAVQTWYATMSSEGVCSEFGSVFTGSLKAVKDKLVKRAKTYVSDNLTSDRVMLCLWKAVNGRRKNYLARDQEGVVTVVHVENVDGKVTSTTLY